MVPFGAGDEARTRFPASHEWLSPFVGALPHLVIGTRFAQVEEIAEAPPVAEEARRFRGSAPSVDRDSGRETAGTTVSAEWQKKAPSSQMVLFGAGDEARTRYLDLGKVALYQMSYARKRKIDYTRESRICQPLRSTFFNFFSKEFR